jgi:hypothetical protein
MAIVPEWSYFNQSNPLVHFKKNRRAFTGAAAL